MKYFKEEREKKIKISDYFQKTKIENDEVEKEYEKYKTGEYKHNYDYQKKYELDRRRESVGLKYRRAKHIYEILGDVEISEEMIETFFETFDSSKSRYKSVCIRKDTIEGLFEIYEMFPELTKEAILEISKEYIKDLYDEYSLIDVLSVMLRKEGIKDETFEKFMSLVKEYAEKEERKYKEVASNIRMYLGYYPYDFIKHFETFVVEHHITYEKFTEALVEPELIIKDTLKLREVSRRAKDCWCIGHPASYEMTEAYLDGDTELSKFPDQPSYHISITGEKIPTVFTKEEFLRIIKEKQKSKKLQ